MVKNWFIKAVWCVPAFALLGACGDSKSSAPEEPKGPGPGPVTTCTDGAPCSCASGTVGSVICGDDGARTCDCPECPALELPEATVGDDCGGEPFGLWRLTKLEFSALEIRLLNDGSSLGTCPTVFSDYEEAPHLLMSLQEGGTAQYAVERIPLEQSWSEDCVTRLSSVFSCGSTA